MLQYADALAQCYIAGWDMTKYRTVAREEHLAELHAHCALPWRYEHRRPRYPVGTMRLIIPR
jgi:hypothetical protein